MTTDSGWGRALLAAVAGLALASMASIAAPAVDGSPAMLKSAFEALRASGATPFGIPLYIASKQTPDAIVGDVHSRLDKPFPMVKTELANPVAWCEILILHPNVKACSVGAGDKSITVRIGSSGTPATFAYEVVRSTGDYLDVRLDAPDGPMGTSYDLRLEAAPLDANATVLHLAYSHRYSPQARFALQTYFGTFGRGKVGFTVVDHTADGKPVYVDDLRGGLERNAMRYYLAIEAHLDALKAAAGQRLEKGLKLWLAQTERYPLQLKEEDGFLERKRGEIKRFEAQATASAGRAVGG